jgi:hypothetical protein
VRANVGGVSVLLHKLASLHPDFSQSQRESPNEPTYPSTLEVPLTPKKKKTDEGNAKAKARAEAGPQPLGNGSKRGRWGARHCKHEGSGPRGPAAEERRGGPAKHSIATFPQVHRMRDGGVGGCPPPLARPQFLSTAINHHHKSSINHQSIINHQLIINPATHSPSHPLTHSLTHAPTHSLTHSLIHSHTHSLTHSLTHPRADHTTSTLTHVGFFGTVSALMFIRFSC